MKASFKAKMPAILNASSLSRLHGTSRPRFDFDVNDLIARIDAAFDGFFDAVDDRRDVFLGNCAADDFVDDFNALAFSFGAT